MTVQEMANGFSVTLPPMGLVRGSKGLFIFAIGWDFICSIALVVFLFVFKPGYSGPRVAPYIGFLVFFIVGVLVMFISIEMGTRRVMIGRVGDVFAIRQISVFRTKDWRWNVADIRRIAMGPSPIKINNRPVPELQITDKNGRKTGFLSERSEAELEWLTGFLAEKLSVSHNGSVDAVG